MKRNSLLAALLAVLVFNNLMAQDPNLKVLERLQEAMDEQQIPGLQLAVLKENEVILTKNLGMADVAFSVPVKDNTIFSINSIAKIFAATAIMQLVEQGKVGLSDPISNYLEGLPLSWRDVTIRQLLSHTSGLPDVEDLENGGLIGGKGQDHAWELVQKKPLQSKAGERFSYNTTNYLLIQKIIEKQGEMSFPDFVQKNQFDRVGIDEITFGNSFDVVANKSSTYSYYVKDKRTNEYVKGEKLVEITEEFAPMVRADAGAFASAEEMIKWIQGLQSGKFLKHSESLETMWKPVPLNNGEYGGFGGFLNGYAFGWPVMRRKDHPGVAPIGGGRASLAIYPKDDLTIILFTNLTGSSPQRIVEDLAKIYWSGQMNR